MVRTWNIVYRTRNKKCKDNNLRVTALKLTIFSTTDVHGAIYPYNYFMNEMKSNALLKFKSYIEHYKNMHEDECVITVDNGDLLQGDVWSEYDSIHPKQALLPSIINNMYDVIGLGNHEFNFGLSFLGDFYEQVNVPIVNSNVDFKDSALSSIIKKSYIMKTEIDKKPINIGFLSVVPTQIMKWDKFHLSGNVDVHPMSEAVKQTAADLKEDGADIIILLSHTGMSKAADDQHTHGENQAMLMALLGCIDGIVFGHTHDLFPHEDINVQDERLDLFKGTFNGIPMVQPGVSASHLGLLSFDLEYDQGWTVTEGKSSLIPSTDMMIDYEALEDFNSYHEKVKGYLNQVVGHTDVSLHTYFSRVIPSRAVQVVSEAVVWYAKGLAEVQKEQLPVLGFNSAIKSGRDGKNDFTDIKAGDLTVTDTVNLYKHANTLVIVKITGKVLREWLEWSASSFNQVGAVSLVKENHSRDGFPGYNFDTFFDLTYTFDLSEPARYRSSAHQISDSNRVVKLEYEGQPIRDEDMFLVAANNYKVAYAPFLRDAEIIYESALSVRDILTEYLKNGETFTDKKPMTLLPHGTYQFTSGSLGRKYTDDLPIRHIEDHGDGFSTYEIDL